MTRAWTRSCAACSVRKGLIFLMLCSANLQDRAVFAMCSLKVSWSSKITPRFLAEADGVIVDEPNWIVKSCCRVGVAGKTRSSVFARLSCRWFSFIHAEMSARQPEIRYYVCKYVKSLFAWTAICSAKIANFWQHEQQWPMQQSETHFSTLQFPLCHVGVLNNTVDMIHAHILINYN